MDINNHENRDWSGQAENPRNAFEALCNLISTEKWCIRQYCGTCGHGLFRLGLKKIAEGMHPDLPCWPVTKDDAELMRGTDSLFPSLFVKFNEEEQRALIEVINAADFEKLSKVCDLSQVLSVASYYTDGIKDIDLYFKYEEPTLWGMTADEWEDLGN